ncbi:MAG TPA: addiction module protein [Stellaceae bacterium]|nr:addiction module protein [Stellaceae bacterium]
MTMIDIDALTPQERLELIGRLWDSLDAEDVTLSAAQAEELGRRLASADADLADSVAWQAVRAELSDRSK